MVIFELMARLRKEQNVEVSDTTMLIAAQRWPKKEDSNYFCTKLLYSPQNIVASHPATFVAMFNF